MVDDAAPLPGSERYREFLRDQSREIRANAEQAGFFEHGPTTGAAREWILRKPLEDVLPYRYGVAGGQVLAADNTISSQWDVLIYSRLDTPRLYNTPAATVLPIEGVLAAISVKSTVNKDALANAAQAATQLREMSRAATKRHEREPWLSPPVYVFGFKGLTLPTLMHHAKAVAPHEGAIINSICVLDKGLILPTKDGRPDHREFDDYGHAPAGAEHGAWGMFLALLWAQLAASPDERPNLMAYVKIADMLDTEPG
jgi:hypothetical protein